VALDPAARFQTASEMRDAVRAAWLALEGAPLTPLSDEGGLPPAPSSEWMPAERRVPETQGAQCIAPGDEAPGAKDFVRRPGARGALAVAVVLMAVAVAVAWTIGKGGGHEPVAAPVVEGPASATATQAPAGQSDSLGPSPYASLVPEPASLVLADGGTPSTPSSVSHETTLSSHPRSGAGVVPHAPSAPGASASKTTGFDPLQRRY
jgi:hypothetical protein